MASSKIIPRLVEPRLVEALDDSPAVLIHGPRQSGKTTLAQIVGKKVRSGHMVNTLLGVPGRSRLAWPNPSSSLYVFP